MHTENTAESNFNTPNLETFKLLAKRRSVKARDMVGDGPNNEDLKNILQVSMRVPDHGKLAPWRFIVLRGDEKEKLGDLIAAALQDENDASETVAEKMKGYATQGPVLVIAVFSPSNARPIPIWEQWLSTGAACQNMLIAATALGYASQWLTGWAATSRFVARGLGLCEHEQIAGFMFLGDHPDKQPTERPRPEFEKQVTFGFPKV